MLLVVASSLASLIIADSPMHKYKREAQGGATSLFGRKLSSGNTGGLDEVMKAAQDKINGMTGAGAATTVTSGDQPKGSGTIYICG